MNISSIASTSGRAIAARPIFHGGFAALLAGLLSVSWPVAPSRAQPADDDEQGGQVLTRGPVHEAFAGVVSFNPEPGIVVRTAPPELIEEIPPEERPEGDDVAWIPGYWGWDDERNDYLWISGTWRTLPPGREWMAGYWRDTGQGWQWISGYWADAEEQETTYLPPPPQTLEIGANIAAPSPDYGWTPGCWVWSRDRYAWRAGYWAQGREDWVWIPAYYVWTPRGVIFVEGFWDYPVQRRGIIFAPVYYQSRGYARRGYSYSPRIVISLSFFNDNLFLRPSYNHYYFGDYYDSRYDRGGFYASYSYQSSRRGYDPFYSHNRWEHRRDRDWENRYQASWQNRRDNEIARPPRTWAAQLTINTRPAPAGQVRITVASPIQQLARSRDNSVRFQAVAQGDRQKFAQRGREVQQSRESRRTVEAKAVVTTGRNEGRAAEPVKIAVPRSPIVARAAGQRGRNQAPPAKPQTPKPDPQVQPRAESRDRSPNEDRRNPSENRQPDAGRNAPSDRRATERARDESQREAQEAQKKAQQAEERANATAAKAQEESQRKAQQAQQRANESAAKAQQDAEKRSRDANVRSQAVERSLQATEERARAAAEKSQRDAEQRAFRAQEESQRRGQEVQRQAEERGKADRVRDESQRKEQQDDAKRANARDEAQQRANEAEARAKQQAEERAKAAAEKGDDESRRRAPQAERKDDDRRGNDAPARVKPAAKEKSAEDEADEERKGKARNEK